jgi:hypothetical protein
MVVCVDEESSRLEMLSIVFVIVVKFKEGNVGFDISWKFNRRNTETNGRKKQIRRFRSNTTALFDLEK